MNINNLIYWLVPGAAFIINGFILMALSLSKKDRLIQSFMWLETVLTFWAFSSLMMKSQMPPAPIFWSRLMTACINIVPLFALLFIVNFIGKPQPKIVWSWGIVLSIMMIAHPLGLTVKEADVIIQVINGEPYYSLHYVVGPLAPLAYFIAFVLLTHCLYLIYQAYRSGIVKANRLYLITWSLFILYVGFLTNAFPAIGKYPLDFLSGIIAAILIVLSIMRDHVLQLRFALTRTLVFTSLMIAVFFFLSVATNNMISFVRLLDLPISNEAFIIIITMIFIAILQPVFSLVHKVIKLTFFKKENEQKALIHDFSLNASHNLDLDNLSSDLLKTISMLANNDNVSLYIKADHQTRFVFSQSQKKLMHLNLDLREDHPFIEWFKRFDDVIKEDYLDHHPHFKSLWEKDRQALQLIRFEASWGLKMNDELIGLIILCHKDYTSFVTDEELTQISTLCATASLAMSNARLFKQFERDAMYDSLTDVYNHRTFLEKFPAMAQKLNQHVVSCILINLDMLSLFNEIHGHDIGDLALIKTAEVIKTAIQDKGMICRYSGDSFAVVLQNIDGREASVIAEQIREGIENTNISHNEIIRSITVSCGVCSAPSLAADDKDLLEKTMKALHHAKINGKNRTVLYQPEMDEEDISANEELNLSTIYALTAAIDAKDHYTFGHSQRVASYAAAIASKLGMDKEEVDLIHYAGLLHDIGKIGIPESVLNKHGSLSDEEYEIMKQHVDMSVTIIKYLPSFRKVIPAVVGHHERWDGQGYPRRIKGEQIPYQARILALADTFDAITSNRHYKTLMSVEHAIREIENNAGIQFDPDIAKVFVNMLRNGEIQIYQSRADLFS